MKMKGRISSRLKGSLTFDGTITTRIDGSRVMRAEVPGCGYIDVTADKGSETFRGTVHDEDGLYHTITLGEGEYDMTGDSGTFKLDRQPVLRRAPAPYIQDPYLGY